MTRDMDVRWLPVRELEVREADEGRPVLRGEAVVYNSLSVPLLGAFRERVMPGAFRETLDSDDEVFALYQHDASLPLAKRSNGTLRIEDGPEALSVEIEPPDTTYGRDAIEAVRAGLVERMSFGFWVREEGDRLTDEVTDDGYPVREITAAELIEVSPVTFPAYEATSLSARSRLLAGRVQERAALDRCGNIVSRRRRLRLAERSV